METIERKHKLQTKFREGNVNFEVLERSTNHVVFLKCQATTMGGGPGNRPWYNVAFVQCEDTGLEFIKPNAVNNADPDSPWFDKDKIYQVYLESITKEDNRKARVINESAEADKSRRALQLWTNKVEVARAEQNALITELKNLNRESDDLRFFENKRAVAILNKLSLLEQYLHHAK